MSERLPSPSVRRIASTEPDASELVELPAGTRVLRVHPLGGPHPSAWDELRSFGPTGSRFDHHPPPPRWHRARSIMYLTVGDEAFTTAVAEYFQDGGGTVGPIDRRVRSPAATAFTLARPVVLLDLASGWVTRAGGNQAIVSGSRQRAREWARAIHRHRPEAQGLVYPSSVYGPGRCVALWERARAAIPAGNDLHRSLAAPAMDRPLAAAAERLGTVLVP